MYNDYEITAKKKRFSIHTLDKIKLVGQLHANAHKNAVAWQHIFEADAFVSKNNMKCYTIFFSRKFEYDSMWTMLKNCSFDKSRFACSIKLNQIKSFHNIDRIVIQIEPNVRLKSVSQSICIVQKWNVPLFLHCLLSYLIFN